MNIGAANLVKDSASKLLYMELNKVERPVSQGQLDGNKYADSVVKKEKGCAEKRGTVKLRDAMLYFCVDMVKDGRFIEIKSVRDELDCPEWYLTSSVLQSTFFATLLQKVDYLDTPKFRLDEGYPNEVMELPKDRPFELWFGIRKFRVHSDTVLMGHYYAKIEVLSEGLKNKSYDGVREWDAKYKFKEFDIFKPKYELIKQ